MVAKPLKEREKHEDSCYAAQLVRRMTTTITIFNDRGSRRVVAHTPSLSAYFLFLTHPQLLEALAASTDHLQRVRCHQDPGDVKLRKAAIAVFEGWGQ